MDLLVSREINDYFLVLIKGFEQEPDMGVKFFHPSIDDDSKATESEIEGEMIRLPQTHHMMVKI